MIIHSKTLYEPYCLTSDITQIELAGFDTNEYSKFKFGRGQVANHYAQLIKEYLFDALPHFLEGQLLICSSAFKFVPTASHSIAISLFENLQLESNIRIEKIKIHRDTLFERDYGTLTQQERAELMAQNHLYFEKKYNFQHKKILVIDDVCVTGSHEQRVKQLLSQTDLSEVCFMYVAKFKNVSNPRLEHSINHTWINSVERFAEIFFSPDFQLNARVCKFLLSYPDTQALKEFFWNVSPNKLLNLKEAFVGDGYDKMNLYQKNYQLMNQILEAKEIILV